jgi:hypothetical protein
MSEPVRAIPKHLEDTSQATFDALIELTRQTSVQTYRAVTRQLTPEQLAAVLLRIATSSKGDADAS